ncbi:hypothetical protein [Microcoleus sp. FACHB-672]|uniref:hypothetical protein n=1 Tax=Microcoleus sp. FACHB-672 TaxID=2692825 RepID=UPI00168792C3|nr:hypothetical protein [Microcoleus sp. FACHB-672]MBD2039459.1 hypothetical protein [Microcoleus sp. FACHB-672]
MMNPTLRREAELYISRQSQTVGYRNLVPTNLQEASDLAVANLLSYFQSRDESEEAVPA